jgi:hypothetical protein
MSPAARWSLVVEAHPEPDALLRVVNAALVLGADIAEAAMAREGDGYTLRLEAEGLTVERAETLLRRVRSLPVVRRAGLGWRAAAKAA